MVDFRDHVDDILNCCTDNFGEAVTLYPCNGGVYKIRGIFDHDYVSVDADTEQLISANQPALGVNLNDVPVDIVDGDIFEIRNLRYRVTDNREDGQGGATLLLHRVDDKQKVFKRPLG